MIEQLYSDFTNKLLPQLQSGLTITKDYFIDLFGRYTNYLIVINSIGVGIGLILIMLGIIGVVACLKPKSKMFDYEGLPILVVAFLLVVGFIIFGINLSSLIKDIYIPEVRIFEIIKNYK